jgi:hypothetical protein
MKPDGLRAEVHVAPDQAVRPEGIGLEGAPEQGHPAGRRSATDEDHHAARRRLQIREPARWERTPRGSRLDAGGGALAVRTEIAPGTLVEGGERIMVEASPNLGLPAAVEVFNGRR